MRAPSSAFGRHRRGDGGETAGPLVGLRVLVVDDNIVCLEITAEQLAQLGASVTRADDGQSALALAETCCFDLIISDLQMPTIDGMAFFRELRSRERQLLRSPVPFVICTSTVASEWPDSTAPTCPEFWLPKPLVVDEFLALVRPLLSRSPP